jgi:hypothetical protein
LPAIAARIEYCEDAHRRALEIGALTLLDKPFDIDYLRELTAQVLG